MKRRSFISGIAGFAGMARCAVGQGREPPNIVFFLSDDHCYWDSSVYGSRVIRTPAMDRLAAVGTVFTHAFAASPTCVPSRAVIMTGLHSARNGSEANHTPMRPGLKTMPAYLKALGYRVAHFGKDHFIPHENYKDMERVPSEIKGTGPLDNDLDTAAFERWLSGLDKNRREPVALIVGSHSPHVFWPPKQDYDASKVDLPPTFVDTPETREARAMYYTDITKMDGQPGRSLRFSPKASRR